MNFINNNSILVKPIQTQPILQTMLQTTITQDTVNNDINLQLFVVKFFYKETKIWIKSDESFKNFTDKNFKSKKGKQFIYKILSYIVTKYNINWYDLRSHYVSIKAFIKNKLKKF